MRIVRALATVALAAGASVGVAVAASPSAQAAGTAMVSILHAVPNTPVDVCANGKPLLPNFQPGTLTDPQNLPAGSYDLKLTAANSGCDAAAVLEAKGVNVPAGANITVVAHLAESGAPQLTPYVNDVSAVPAGKARLTVRHDAAAPAVDVRAGGAAVITNLTNPNEKSAESRRPARCPRTSSSPGRPPWPSARRTSPSRRGPARSCTRGAAPRTTTSSSRSRPSPACTPRRAGSTRVPGTGG